MFEIFQSEKNEKYYFHLKARNGQVILVSQGYTDKSSARKGVESVKTHAGDESRFERKTASNGKFHFNLKASNGQIIGSSQMYTSEAGLENGIDSVMNHATDADIRDLTTA
ncbi:YegP family protein [Robertkochia aurantiaca]|uniref:YegP family protein n=1 Tax=Robertkochia aurantiaca TaxID=2873700 RepID=UPI001CCB59F9|nr:YegP family protein [Robertkochia sp. 3YJGBD-33]